MLLKTSQILTIKNANFKFQVLLIKMGIFVLIWEILDLRKKNELPRVLLFNQTRYPRAALKTTLAGVKMKHRELHSVLGSQCIVVL